MITMSLVVTLNTSIYSENSERVVVLVENRKKSFALDIAPVKSKG